MNSDDNGGSDNDWSEDDHDGNNDFISVTIQKVVIIVSVPLDISFNLICFRSKKVT